MSFNKITIVARLGRDPELRSTPHGTPVCTLWLATDERRRDARGFDQDVTTWFRVSLWGRQAEAAARYLTKGRLLYIEGRLRVEEYTDREGRPRYWLEVSATDMQFIGGGTSEAGERPAMKRTLAAAGVHSPQPGTWTIKNGMPVRSAPPETKEAGSTAEDDTPF